MNTTAVSEPRRTPTLAARIASWLTMLGVLCALLVMLGSCGYRTSRIYEDSTGSRDGFSGGQAIAFLGGGAAILLLVLAASNFNPPFVAAYDADRGLGRKLAAIAALALGAASAAAVYYWLPSLNEQRVTDHLVFVGAGLRMVALFGAAGALLALLACIVSLVFSRDGP